MSTLSAYVDHNGDLPISSAYPAEIADLRDQGKYLIEIGLFADRRQKLTRSIESLRRGVDLRCG